MLIPAIQTANEASSRLKASGHLKMISLALRDHHDSWGYLPRSGSVDLVNEADANRRTGLGLSWRVHILPYLGEGELYEQFDLDERWDSEHNLQLVECMPEVFRSPHAPSDEFKTVFLGVLGPAPGPGVALATYTCFAPGVQKITFGRIVDGTSNTVAIFEADADQAVIWTRPGDWQFTPDNPRRGLGGLRPRGFLAGFADSSIDLIPNSIDDEALRRLFGRADGRKIEGYTPPSWRDRASRMIAPPTAPLDAMALEETSNGMVVLGEEQHQVTNSK